VCVNLSGRQVADAELVDDVRRVLVATGLTPNALTLEITETVLVQDVEATVAAFRALKALGVRLAIDDFGTGYSSLSYLRQFPIDTLKIDRSFVAGLDGSEDSTALVRSILSLSSTLRLDTVAEGIETTEQRLALRRLGAQRGQGYLFARPMPPTEVGELLSRPAARLDPASATTPRPETRRPAKPRRTSEEPRPIRT
jgi:EAL domain-containing protein (putative c-di-GMP-specific phosphodiesterase class I)